ARCASELAALHNAFHALAFGLDPINPSVDLTERLLASATAQRFAPLVPRVAELFDLPTLQANQLLVEIDQAELWQPSPWPNVRFRFVMAGAARAGALTILVKIEAGTVFPRHRHLGEEYFMV